MASVAMDRLRKQDLLLLNVRCMGVQPEEFVRYIASIKGDSFDNLDAWDIAELRDAIEAFKQSSQFMNQQNDSAEQSKPGVMNSAFAPNSSQVMASQRMTFQLNLSEQFQRTEIPCRKPTDNAVTGFCLETRGRLLQAKVSEYKIVDEGFFSRNYCRYQVEVPELNWCVWRRFNEFEWLRNALLIQFPDSLVPPLPKKTLQKPWKKFDDGHISKRVRMFELFLTSILNSSLLRTSDFVIAFLSLQEDQKLNAIMLSTEQMKKYPDLKDYTALEGNITCELNPFLSKYYQQMHKYLENILHSGSYLMHSNDIYKKITDNSKSLFIALEDVQQKMRTLNSNLVNLRQITEHFNDNNIVGNLGLLGFSYKLLEDYLNNWEQNIEDLKKTYNVDSTNYNCYFKKQNFYEFFRFQRDMQNECLELIEKRNDAESRFLSSDSDLVKKKSKYFAEYPIEKWQLTGDYDAINIKTNKKEAFEKMLPAETAQVEVNRLQFGFINKQLFEQFTEYFDHKGVVYITSIHNQLSSLLSLRSFENMQQLQLNEDWVRKYYEWNSVQCAIGIKKVTQI